MTTAVLSVPVFDAGYNSPHLAPLFPARWYQASAPEAPRLETVRTRLRDAVTRQEGCAMKTWLNVGEGAEYAGLSRDSIYTRRASARSCATCALAAGVRFG